MKYLLLFAVIAVVWLIWKKRSAPSGKAVPPTPRDPERMVVCAHCGVHLPRSEALTNGPRHYCCAEHQRQDAG